MGILLVGKIITWFFYLSGKILGGKSLLGIFITWENRSGKSYVGKVYSGKINSALISITTKDTRMADTSQKSRNVFISIIL